MRRAFSLIEVLMSLAILAVCMTGLYGTFSASRTTAVRADIQITARFLATSILDSAVHRLHVGDPRFYNLQTPAEEVVARAAAGDWQKPFLTLACPRTPVLTPKGTPNPYFDPDTGPVLATAQSSKQERDAWAAYSYEVRVRFDVAPAPGAARRPIDADADGQGETDLAALEVEVFHETAGAPPRSAAVLTTLAVSPDKAPGEGALARP